MISEDAKCPMIGVMAEIGAPRGSTDSPAQRCVIGTLDSAGTAHCRFGLIIPHDTTYLKQQVKDSMQARAPRKIMNPSQMSA